MSVIHPAGGARLKERSEALVPKIILMPVSQLLDANGQKYTGAKLRRRQDAGTELEADIAEAEFPGAHAH